MSFEENAKITKQCVEYAKSVNPNILVEAELGYIGSGSNIKDVIPEGAGILTKPEEAKNLWKMTGVDMLAPSVGSIHGLIKSGKPHIDAELVAEIKELRVFHLYYMVVLVCVMKILQMQLKQVFLSFI